MGDHDSLLRAVLANPADDAPRLIYADWCDDYGWPLQAEFVRRQMAHPSAEVYAWLSGKRWKASAKRAIMFKGLTRLVRGMLPDAGMFRGMDAFGFRRGFVEWMEISESRWRLYGDRLATAYPITDVTIRECNDPDYLKRMGSRWRGIRFSSPRLWPHDPDVDAQIDSLIAQFRHAQQAAQTA